MQLPDIYKPYNYQIFGQMHMRHNPYCGLFLDMGLGKTVIALTELEWMHYQDMTVRRSLVIGPKRVILSVWKQEAEKWAHTRHLKISIVWGTVQQRIDALRVKADIYLINRENVVWLVGLFQSKWPFDNVVIDESSSFKNHASQRFKALKSVRPYIERVTLLTGTPAPNGLLDLWPQIFLLDLGQRLEKSIGGYRNRYFLIEQIAADVITRKYVPRKESVSVIHEKIGDICISMKSEDYLDLPEVIINDIKIDLPEHIKRQYDEFEEEQVMMIANQEITALSAGALTNKLLQFANGAVYLSDKSGDYVEIHDEKLNALQDIMDEAQGNPVMVLYAYKHDMERIKRRFPQVRRMLNQTDIDDWNAGKIAMMLGHPASMGHGLNLQSGGHILTFFGLTWSLELYLQVIKRLHRQGQKWVVVVNRIICKATWDIKVARALLNKDKCQNELLEAVKAMVKEYILKSKN